MLSGEAERAISAAQGDIPLVVDVDWTLLRTDLLHESLLALIAKRPLAAFNIVCWAIQGRAALKARLGEAAFPRIDLLPVEDAVLKYVRAERARGRRVYLASASDRRIVEALAERIGLFDGVFASDGRVNLKGRAKAQVLVEAFGPRGFDYVGDSRADVAVWRTARAAVMLDPSAALRRAVSEEHPEPKLLYGRPHAFTDYLSAMRVHQWLKNTLLFLPMLAAHAITAPNLVTIALAFFAFSMVASSIYIVNDLLDLAPDRQHRHKRLRPFASGALPLARGVAMSAVLLAAGMALAALVGTPFALVVAAYVATTIVYSTYLKRRLVVDVIALAGLYTLRVLGGAAAVEIGLSPWMLAFSMFLFLCLALVKRYAELKACVDTGTAKPAGRSYVLADAPLLIALAGASGYASVVVLALYINSSGVTDLYSRPEGLWLVCTLLLYWVTRVLLIAHRGAMHHDPLVFALRDRGSRATVAASILLIAASATL